MFDADDALTVFKCDINNVISGSFLGDANGKDMGILIGVEDGNIIQGDDQLTVKKNTVDEIGSDASIPEKCSHANIKNLS